MQTFYSNGKLLLTGEYVVLDGALSLALPTHYGQSLIVKSIEEPKIIWKSFDHNNLVWFEEEYPIENGTLKPLKHDHEISFRLSQILIAATQLNPNFLKGKQGFYIESKLTFPREWGLGTSSTLINNIAQWAKVDAYQLLEHSFGGSGYDIACTQHDFPITYQLLNTNKENMDQNLDSKRKISKVNFDPIFKDNLYFVHLNKKQDTKEGIKQYRIRAHEISNEISEISKITLKMIASKQLNEFEKLIDRHETIISKIIGQKPVKSLLFSDFNGSLKSLGAWGGDFILATSSINPTEYFKSKGYETVIPFDKMILK